MSYSLAVLVFASACGDSTAQGQAPECADCTPTETYDDSTAPLVCRPGQPNADLDPASGLVPVWRTDPGPGDGLLSTEVADGLIVAKRRNGRAVTLDAETGGECAELVAAPETGHASTINVYNPRAKIVHGMLIGSSSDSIRAIGIRTGTVRWTRMLLPPWLRGTPGSLSNSLKVIGTSTAIVIGSNASNGREVVVAIDPRTGVDLWRKVVVERGRPHRTSDEGEVTLATDGTRVFVRTNGTLTAYAGNGTATWSTSWTPVARGEFEPVTLANRLPLVAASRTHVALAFDGRIQIIDASSGAPVGDVAVPGIPTEIVADEDLLVASVETKPGTAAVVAIDMATAQVRWSFDAAYSAQSLRVDEELVYLLDGNRRVWGLERASGAKRFGLGTGAPDFAVTRSRTGIPRIFPAQSSVAALDATKAEPPPLEPFPHWTFDTEFDGRYNLCRLRTLRWVDGNDRTVWEREVPARMRDRSSFCGRELDGYRRAPRFAGSFSSSMFGTSVNDDTLVEANATGILALNLRDGSVQLDAGAPQSRGDYLFNEGKFEVEGLADCKGPSSTAQVFARCGDRYVYFNGTTALVLSGAPLRVEATGTYRSDATEEPIAGMHALYVRAAIPAGDYVFRLEGTQYIPE